MFIHSNCIPSFVLCLLLFMPSIFPSGAFLGLFNSANWTATNTNTSEDTSDSDVSDSDSDLDASHATNVTNTNDHEPFSWPTWQARTGFMQPIFSLKLTAGTPQKWWNKEDNAAVWSFVTKFWSLSLTNRVCFLHRNRQDNDLKDCTLYLDWFKAESSKWHFNCIILSSLKECSVDPYSYRKLDTKVK